MENYQEVPWNSINRGDLIKVRTTSNAQPLDGFDCMLNYDGEVMRKQNNPSESILRKTDGSLVPVVSDDIYAHGCEVTFYKYMFNPFNIASYETSGKLKRRRPHPGDYNGMLDQEYRRRPRKRKILFGAPKKEKLPKKKIQKKPVIPMEFVHQDRNGDWVNRNGTYSSINNEVRTTVDLPNGWKRRVTVQRPDDPGRVQGRERRPRSPSPRSPNNSDDEDDDEDEINDVPSNNQRLLPHNKGPPPPPGGSGRGIAAFGQKKRNLKGNLKILKKDLKKLKKF